MNRLGPAGKARLAGRIWLAYVRVRATLLFAPLPRAVQVLGRGRKPFRPSLDHRRLGRIIDRVLRLGPLQPRCLSRSLVLYHLVRQEGSTAALVLGLPVSPEGHEAHAWVEVEGVEVGPPPGRMGHEELARYS